MKQPSEIRKGSERLCARFLKVQANLANYHGLSAYRDAISKKRCDGHYSVAVGLFIRDLDMPSVSMGIPSATLGILGAALEFYCYGILSAFVNHAVKLVPLGQLDGQSALFESMRGIPAAARKALAVSIDDLGVSGCGFDLRAMQHETLAGRLYSS
jgi:urease accessory protein